MVNQRSSHQQSVLLYGAEIWGVGNTDTIETAQLKYYKALLYLPQNTPKYAVIQETGIKSIEMAIKMKCLSWWIKLLNAPDNSNIKLCYTKLLENSNNDHNWVTRFKDKLFPEELDFIWRKQDMKRNDNFWQVTLYHHQQQLDNSILELTNKSTSLYWYKYLEPSNNHLYLDLPVNIINTFCQIRLLNKY